VRTFRLTLEYDGTAFSGWQVQDGDCRTLQGTLADALAEITGETVSVTGSGRTDAGVHAEAQVASVRLETRIEPGPLRRALNSVLPHDVAVRDVEHVADEFHALRDARGKHYRYAVWNGSGRSPLRARTHHFVAGPLDLDAMRKGAAHLVGVHDFASFQAAGSDTQTTVRTLTALDLEGQAGSEILFQVRGEGFLRHMVRILVGTLLDVGRGRRSPDQVAAILEARSRPAAGPTAPAPGLTLVAVEYEA
jgi:tRNA pseudouridine38-40 synthase